MRQILESGHDCEFHAARYTDTHTRTGLTLLLHLRLHPQLPLVSGASFGPPCSRPSPVLRRLVLFCLVIPHTARIRLSAFGSRLTSELDAIRGENVSTLSRDSASPELLRDKFISSRSDEEFKVILFISCPLNFFAFREMNLRVFAVFLP